MRNICNITEFFDDVVSRYAEHSAVIDGDRETSFSSLYQQVRSIAQTIHETFNFSTKNVVGVFLDKGVDAIATDIAVSYSSNAYMNVSVKDPEARLRNIITQIEPDLFITSAKYFKKLQACTNNIPILILEDIDFFRELSTDEIDTLLAVRNTTVDTDLLCIINTSGSTGTPKGVALHHLSWVDFTHWAIAEKQIAEREVISFLSPITFDMYNAALAALMMCGATMVLIPEAHHSFPVRILEALQRHRVSFIFCVPTIMVTIANMDLLRHIPLPDLQRVWFAGEVLPTVKYNYWAEFLPHARFVNLYGPIEITTDCTYYELSGKIADDAVIPIGKVCKNSDVFLLRDDAPVAPGDVGEICVRGTSLALGYYNNQEATRKAFVQNPLNSRYPERIYRTGDMGVITEDGTIFFKGRKDTLVKRLGYRIELAELENVTISKVHDIKNCCAIFNEATQDIVLFYIASDEICEREIRKQLAAQVPQYMVPTVFKRMDVFPENGSGKIDRALLKQTVVSC